MEYFGNSIEQAVNSRRHFRQHDLRDLGHQYGGSAYGSFDMHQISNLSFEMWVSLPEKMEEALHNYTRLQSNRLTTEPIILETIKNWRSMYPRLNEIINHWTPSERCDVIMLDASFQLMTDFPPKGSKLGISLELDFMDPSNRNYKALEDMQLWEGSTTIYDRGRKVREAWYDDCHSTSTGKVKPFFESKYWATTFTDLTERRRRAEDLKNDAAIEVANERSRNQLKHLTVIQEIYASPTRNSVLPQKRMAILLWKFSQAQPHWAVGITTWQRLIPPPDRPTTNSPPPTQEMGVSPLSMDNVIDMGINTNGFDTNYDWGHFDPHQCFASFGHDFDEELCQDSTTMTKHSPNTANQLASMQASFAIEATQGTANRDIHNMPSFGFDLPLHDSQYGQPHEGHVASGNVFETQLHNGLSANYGSQNQQHVQIGTEATYESLSTSQHPLSRFDVSTHKLLQAQLGQANEHNTDKNNGIDDEVLRQALVAASANELGNEPDDNEHLQDIENGRQHSWTAPPTSLTRPQLQSHASFAGRTSHAHDQQQQDSPLQEISHNAANLDANHMVAALSVHSSYHPACAPAQEDHYQSTGNTQSSASFHLDNSLSGSHDQYRNLGGSFVDMEAEVQGSMGESFVIAGSEKMERNPK